MAKEKMRYTDHYPAVMEALASRGLLLGAAGPDGRPNVMTIGWGAIGAVWGKPMWIVLVRPSRHTFGLIEAAGCFTVNVPPPVLAPACEACGTRSGREIDKFREFGLTVEKALRVAAPIVAECPIVYECRVVHANDVREARLAAEIVAAAYPKGDFHRVYWGEILAARADREAARLLGE